MLFLQLPPVHSSSTARPPDHPLQSRSSISSLLPCYFCTSSPSTARPPPVHRIIPFNLAPPSLASSHAISALPPRPVRRILTSRSSISSLLPGYFAAPASTGSWPRSRSSISSLLPCYFCSSRPSTAAPPPVHRILTFEPVHRILTFDLAPPSLASSHAISAPPARPQLVHRILTFDLAPPSLASHAISAAPARPQPVHRPSTGSWPSISLLHL